MRDAREGWTARHWVAALVLVLVSAFLNITALRETRHGDLIIAEINRRLTDDP